MDPTVVHLLDGLGHGGNETLCLQIVRHSPPHVANVVIYQDPARTEMLPLFRDVPGLRLHCVPTRGRLRLIGAWMLANEIRRHRPVAALIYAFGLHHLLAALAASVAGVTSVHAAAGNRPPHSPDARRRWRAVLWLSAVLGVPVHACSLAVERSLRELGSHLPRGSGAIPNGCDVAGIAARAARARRLRARDGRLVIGMVARLDPIKDQATLIRAFAEMANRHPQTELWLIGDGVRAWDLCALAAAEGVADRVVFWGPRADVPELLGQIDVFAFSTTRDEGFGIALIEAMAAGLPVVASDVPACREVLADGAAGILVPEGSCDALATTLQELCANPAERRHWGSVGHRHAVQHYDIRDCGRTWYRTLLPDYLIWEREPARCAPQSCTESRRMRRILIAAGNPCDVGFRGGQPYYFYAAGRALSFIHEALPLAPERLMLRRVLWNIANLVTCGTPFGFQYSRTFRHHLFEPYRGKCGATEYISYFPLLPPEPWRNDWIVNFYIDATLKQNFDDYGLGAKLSRRTRAQAIDQECRNYDAAKLIVCRSLWAASSVVQDYGIDPQKVHVVVPGASLDEPVEEEASRSACSTLKPLRLGLLGKDWERKGLRFLLSVVDALELRGVETELVVIGPDSNELPKHRSIRSLGYLDKGKDALRLMREIRSWHFGCLFPRAEALPSSLRECLRLGVPILARRIGGVAEALPPGLGFLFEPDASSDQVIDLLIRLVDEPDQYAKLRTKVGARSKEFSWNRTLEKFIDIWQGSDAFAYERKVNAHG